MTFRRASTVTFLGVAMVLAACGSSSSKSAPSTTTTTEPTPSVLGTSATVATTTTTTAPAPTPTVPAPAPAGTQTITRTITRTITITPGTTVPPKTYSGTVDRVTAEYVSTSATGGVQVPTNRIARSVAEAQAIYGTQALPAWIATWPFQTDVLVFNFRGIQDGQLYPCLVGTVAWRTQPQVLFVKYGLMCYGGVPPWPSPFPGRSLEYSVYPIPAVAAAGVTTIIEG